MKDENKPINDVIDHFNEIEGNAGNPGIMIAMKGILSTKADKKALIHKMRSVVAVKFPHVKAIAFLATAAIIPVSTKPQTITKSPTKNKRVVHSIYGPKKFLRNNYGVSDKKNTKSSNCFRTHVFPPSLFPHILR